MKRSVKTFIGYNLSTKDKVKGKVMDFFFDQDRWIIRYMEADQGKILPNKKVLIPRALLDDPDSENENFNVRITRDELKKCPATDEKKPVSREYETRLLNHLDMKNYWAGVPPATDGMMYPLRPVSPPQIQINEEDINTNLRSFNEILGYEIQTPGGKFGKLTDIIVDDEDWHIIYFIATDDTCDFDRELMVPISWISKISYKDQQIILDIDTKELKNAPEFNPAAPINIEYEKKIFDYYGRLQNSN
ncbi:MAG: PRC-barrel domain-containing protein [Bacteroidales bacterium]